MSREVTGRWSAWVTWRSSATSWASVRQTLHPGPLPTGGPIGSTQPLNGSRLVSSTPPAKVESYAAGPLESWY